MDPLEFASSEELYEDIIYSVEKLVNLCLNHSGRAKGYSPGYSDLFSVSHGC